MMNSEGMQYPSSSMYNAAGGEYGQQPPQMQQQPMAARPRVDVDASGEVDPTA